MLDIIPQQQTGKETNLSHSEAFSSKEEANKCFYRAYRRMLNPRIWHKLGGLFSANFELIGEQGIDPHRLIDLNDYLKIDIPGPGPSVGGGYDWVCVEKVSSRLNPDAEEESVGILLRPCSNPTNAAIDTAHFFKTEATSTFIIARNRNKVTASYHGRNETPNTGTENTMDNIRNAIVASGALASLSEAQWAGLIKAFLQAEIGD